MQTAHSIGEAFQVLATIFVLGAIVYTIIANRREEGEPTPEEDNWLGPEGVARERRRREKAANYALDRIVMRIVGAKNHGHSLKAEAWRAVTGERTTNEVGIRWLNHVLEHRRAHDEIDKEVYDAILFGIQMAWSGNPAPSLAKTG